MITPTPRQQQIRDHTALDLVVVAPAGCGKTEALALRVAGLLERGVVAQPQRILVTTFSNRARDNIRDRLLTYVSVNAMRDRVTVSNFHGLAARIFRAHAAVIGLNPEMLLPENDWVREQCQRRKLTFAATAAVESVMQSLKLEAVDDDEVERRLVDAGEQTALEIERQRRSEGRLTYDDLPRLAELILASDRVAQLYRNHFGAVMVDEYQDLTPQQLRLVNRMGFQKTTYAGDLAQGIYGFAGARPAEVDDQIRSECSAVIEFAESHRSSPAVLRVVNALTGLTGGQILTCAATGSWPGGGLAGGLAFNDASAEANAAVAFAQYVLDRAPSHRIGIIARTGPRRRFVDAAVEARGLPSHRWDDPMLDTDTAKAIRALLARLDTAEFHAASDPLMFLRDAANLDSVQDPSSRTFLNDALSWCFDLLRDGLGSAEIRQRVRVGDEHTLLNVPGVHLLTGHVGKGQQFDWVFVVGVEEDTIPDFRANTPAALTEESRILSVMVSRARHGVVISYAAQVVAQTGRVMNRQPSRYWHALGGAGLTDRAGMNNWLAAADWGRIAAR